MLEGSNHRNSLHCGYTWWQSHPWQAANKNCGITNNTFPKPSMALNSNGRMKAKAVRLTAIAHALTFNINPRQGACWDQKVIHSDTPRKVLATCLCIISHTLYETVFTVAPPPAQQSSDKKIVLLHIGSVKVSCTGWRSTVCLRSCFAQTQLPVRPCRTSKTLRLRAKLMGWASIRCMWHLSRT